MSERSLRLIRPEDNSLVKSLVRNTLAEFGLAGEGYAGVDAELDDMFSAYNNALSAYYVIDCGGAIQGVGGFAPLLGSENDAIAELRKMYFVSDLRGQGWGHKLIELCLNEAKKRGFTAMYLETVPDMQVAQKLYLKHGFGYISERLGETGHHHCEVSMLKRLI